MTERIPKSEWETPEMWRKYVERQLYELGTLVRGQVQTFSERIADLVEMVQAVSKEQEALRERQDKMADFIRSHVKEHKNGGTSG